MATPILAGTAGAMSLDPRRVELALDALDEVRALSIVLRNVLASESDEATIEALGRGMLARVQVLADAAADALDPAGEPVDAIAQLVTCRAAA